MDSKETKVPFQEQFRLFVGFDWAKDHHDVAAVDAAGTVILELSFADTAQGWAQLRQRLTEQVGSDLSLAAVAVETRHGPAIERLLEIGCRVYPINPKSAQRYRERKAPAGGRTDSLDAWSLADALRTDGHAWKSLLPDDPRTQSRTRFGMSRRSPSDPPPHRTGQPAPGSLARVLPCRPGGLR